MIKLDDIYGESTIEKIENLQKEKKGYDRRIDTILAYPPIKKLFYIDEAKMLLDKIENLDKIIEGYLLNYAIAWISKNEQEIFDHINKENKQ